MLRIIRHAIRNTTRNALATGALSLAILTPSALFIGACATRQESAPANQIQESAPVYARNMGEYPMRARLSRGIVMISPGVCYTIYPNELHTVYAAPQTFYGAWVQAPCDAQ